VLYLNEDWQADDGGELQIFEPTGVSVIVTERPKFGTMNIFLSEMFPHEVLISHNTRRSIAGWFRVSGSLSCVINHPFVLNWSKGSVTN